MSWFAFSLSDFSTSFLSILFEGIPFLLLGALIAGVVDVFVPARWITRLLPKNPTAAVCVSGLLGGIFPMCECGSVVVVRRFIAKGLPVSSAVAYMLGAPIVSPLVALSTYAAFQGQNAASMTFFRLFLGYLVAIGAGLMVQRMRLENVLIPALLPSKQASRPTRVGLTVARGGGSMEEDLPESETAILLPQESRLAKCQRVLQTATSDFLDVAFFFVIGAGATALFNTAIKQEIILPLASNDLLAVPAMMGLASVLALCSTTDAFIAASFVAFSSNAKLAFLLFGPLMDVKLLFLYGIVFQRKFIFKLACFLFFAIALICIRFAMLPH